MALGFKKQSVGVFALLAVLLCVASASAQAQSVQPNQPPLVLTVPGTYNYANSFNGVVAGSSFVDLFEFTITPANFNTAATTISLGDVFGISDLRATLFSGGGISGTNLLSGWSTPILVAPTVETTMFSINSLVTGTYTLAVKGTFNDLVSGAPTTGGSYSGVFNLTNISPVPEPSSGLAILAGLALVGFQLNRKMKPRN